METRETKFDAELQFESGDWAGFQVQNTTEHLREEFPIHEAIIAVGDYDFTSFFAWVEASNSRNIFGTFIVQLGEYYSGDIRGVRIDGTIKPNARLSMESLVEFNRITFPDKAFNANVFGGRVSYSFSTTLFTKLFAQWSSEKDAISTNFLINYIYRPGSDFYLVFNQKLQYGRRWGKSPRLDTRWEDDVLVESVRVYGRNENPYGEPAEALNTPHNSVSL